MPGMPSARGIEWKGDGRSHERFEHGFDNIPRDPVTGNWVIEPVREPEPVKPQPPKDCYHCSLKENCEVECSHGSPQCRARLGI